MKRFIAAITFKLKRILANNNRYRPEDPLDVQMVLTEKQGKLWLAMLSGNHCQKLSFPVPYKDEVGNTLIGRRVARAVGTWQHQGIERDYWQLMTWLLTGRIEDVFPGASKRNQLERLALSFDSSMGPLSFKSVQDMVDGIVNKLPLSGTPYESWAMCNRVIFLDPKFNALTPEEALEYQKHLNMELFPWTSLGLSDSGMVNNNLLKVDLREYTPFGIRHHNPMRNLYQTLGMKGSEAPTVITQSAAKLSDQGIERRGWNWMTCFLSVPPNFEDQLIVDNRHLDKFTLENRRLICFGDVKVSAGEELPEGALVSIEPNAKELRWWVRADRSLVVNVEEDCLPFNGQDRNVKVVYIETKHAFKEGIKLTNCHGNKGVVTFADCGTLYDEGRAATADIDIIVSSATISKRKNYGQVLEALTTLIHGTDRQLVIRDDVEVPGEEIRKSLIKHGYNPEGTSSVRTSWGDFDAICGWLFWGLIKNPEAQLWTKAEVTATDNRDRRTAGIKISHIELKGLTTIFGPDNPVIDEILGHQQGMEDVCQLVEILESLRGKTLNRPLLDWSAIKPLVQDTNYFHTREELGGTIVDESTHPEGFVLTLPRIYHIFIPENLRQEVQETLLPVGTVSADLPALAIEGGKNVFIDKVPVPGQRLRACWQHSTGLWGLSDIGGYLNTLVSVCHQVARGEVTDETLLRAVRRYFHHVSRRLSTKRGEIATYALAIRYPNSAKATATLAKDDLPKDYIEIHSSMAETLQVSTGDYVMAERFPCLGFKSLRIQRVRVTDDEQCRFVIRVSGNSLVSQNLDFDGDVLFLMSFKTQAAVETLKKEFNEPDPLRRYYIEAANAEKTPLLKGSSLSELEIETFPDLTRERQVEIVAALTGVKRGTGTTVALSYNVMRIIEGGVGFNDRSTNLAMEVILDTVANSVFGQKHAGFSLEERCKQAICTADITDMKAMGFPESGSQRLCQLIVDEAKSIGVNNLHNHYKRHKHSGRSNIINEIVRHKHKLYFATRSDLHPVRLLEHLDSPATDLVSHLWYRSLKAVQEKKEAETTSVL